MIPLGICTGLPLKMPQPDKNVKIGSMDLATPKHQIGDIL